MALFEGLFVKDDFLPDPLTYVEEARCREYRSYDFEHCVFHGISVAAPDSIVPGLLRQIDASLDAKLTFIRRSPLNQVEPHFIHTDVDMGEWSALLYLNRTPPDGDGTSFWTHLATGEIGNPIPHLRSQEGQHQHGWKVREKVLAKFNRLVIFPSHYYHSRSIFDNWGDETEARLVQVAFGGKGL